MEDFMICIITLGLLMFLVVGVIGIFEITKTNKILKTCAAENNVYQCEFVAVPKGLKNDQQ